MRIIIHSLNVSLSGVTVIKIIKKKMLTLPLLYKVVIHNNSLSTNTCPMFVV